MSSLGSSELRFEGGGHSRALSVRRMTQARRIRLSVDPRDGAIRLVLPKRAPLKAALAWVEGQRGWIEAALAAIAPTEALAPGTSLSVRGRILTIDWADGRPRGVRIDGDRLVIGGPLDSVAPRIMRWLRAEALRELTALTIAFSQKAGVVPGPVGVGDPRSRWGSCASSGAIRYSWRLILAPAAVIEATVAHEVAHRLHMDHSPAFHAAVARLLGRDPQAERAWLRKHGAGLHAVGRC